MDGQPRISSANLSDRDHDLVVMGEIARRLRDEKRLTFAEFMEVALYLPGAGYYARRDAPSRRDYRTSPQTHPIFGALLALQLEQMWRVVGRPRRFTIVELGAGEGRLCRDVMAFAGRLGADFEQAVEYVAVDVASDVMVHEAPLPAMSIVASALELPLDAITGCLLSNELADAFPVHRVLLQDGRWYESYVVERGGMLSDELGELSTPELVEYFERLGLLPREGCLVEVNLAGRHYIREAARVLDRGFILTIDYGLAAEDLYLSRQPAGSLRCFHQHRCHGNPLIAVGNQDITAHVDFSGLVLAGREAGLRLSGLTAQRDFLRNLGFETLLEGWLEDGLPIARRIDQKFAAQELVSRAGLGDFRVLAQHKGLSDPELDGFNPCNDRRRAMLARNLHLGLLAGRVT